MGTVRHIIPPAPRNITAPAALNTRIRAIQGGFSTVSDQIVYTSDANFQKDVLSSDVPVLVDYWAEWCGPCKMIAPILDEIAGDYQGKLKIAKVNVDENQQVTQKYGIRSIPTLMIFKGGSVQAQKVGAMSKSQLAAFIETNL
ncbi:MAG TPA: thioredoxin TrxA [Gammaproteobacteria bacterium]|jgi:thioredoxin 1|nr:thioredoxin TrxA [Gammaproteobacteria bacterium]